MVMMSSSRDLISIFVALEFLSIPATLTNANGLTDVCVVARCADKGTELGLNWIEFQP
jgi:hypothetical protein